MPVKEWPFWKTLLAIAVVGAGLRFAVAPERALEFRADTLLFQTWGYGAHERGLLNLYERPVTHPTFTVRQPVDYLPPYLYILWGAEGVRRAVEPAALLGSRVASVIFKTPAVLAELATVVLLAVIVKRRSGSQWGLAAGALYALNPGTLFTTAGWGQVDSVATLLLVLTVWLMERRRLAAATAAVTVACFVKMQSVILVPLLAYDILRTRSAGLVVRAWLTSVGVSVGLTLPYLAAGRARDVFLVIVAAKHRYPFLSLNAFNLWWLLDGPAARTASDVTVRYGLRPYTVGLTLFAAAVGLTLWYRVRVPSGDGRWLAAAFLAFSFFMLPTEMHERYLFPVFALLLPALPASRPARWVFGGLAVTFLLNLLLVRFDAVIPATVRSASIPIAAVNTALFLAAAGWLARSAYRRSPATA